jgi:putative nucleotidyltransferase with HDIG domain
MRLAQQLLRADLTINAAETELRRKQAESTVKEAVLSVKKGQRVLGDGELINETHLQLLSGMRKQVATGDRLQLQFGSAGLAAVLVGCAWLFCLATFRRWRLPVRDAVFLGLTLVGMLGLSQVWMTVTEALRDAAARMPVDALPFAIPLAGSAMLVRFVLDARASLFFALVQSALVGVLFGASFAMGGYALAGSLIGIALISRVQDRAGILRAGLITGGVNGLMVIFLHLAAGKGLGGEVLSSALVALIGTTMTVPVVVMAATPVAELLFGYASDVKLLELANLNHPALKELIVQAPGTYHHSIIMGTLVENAASAIGANPLLARTCAYYHDIGKGRNPLYFGENQKGENRHDTLAPAMSATIIKRHVTDGLEMARHYRLPRQVADAIPQHHGTRTVGFFLHKAIVEAEGRPELPRVDEEVFRYPGPKPQTREAALVMISDAVEASCRALPEPTPPRLQAQVQKMINMVFGEGQLDECDLTLKDLHLIADSFSRTLQGIYHSRPEYPAGALKPQRLDALPVVPELPAPSAAPRPTGSI